MTIPFRCLLLALFTLGACTPEVGSSAWCRMMEDKPKGQWTLDQGSDYAQHCLLRGEDGLLPGEDG